MGGYYIHALVHLLGPVKRAAGFTQLRRGDRAYSNTKHPRFGEAFHVDTINALAGSLEFTNGVMGNIALVSEGFGETSRIEIYGREGTLICPNPNEFGGPVYLKRSGNNECVSMPLTHGFGEGCNRGIGVADMAWGIVNGRPHRAHGDLGFHAFEIIHGIWKASEANTAYEMTSTCAQPAPLPSGYVEPGMDEYSLAL